jgi:hypothetical protein
MGSLISIPPSQRARAERLKVRLNAWPLGARPGESAAFCAEVAPLCLPRMFEAVELAFQFDDGETVYQLSTWEPLFNVVRLNNRSWKWVVSGGSAEGRGLVSLWAWRFDVGCTTAHMELMVLANQREQAPKRRGKAS